MSVLLFTKCFVRWIALSFPEQSMFWGVITLLHNCAFFDVGCFRDDMVQRELMRMVRQKRQVSSLRTKKKEKSDDSAQKHKNVHSKMKGDLNTKCPNQNKDCFERRGGETDKEERPIRVDAIPRVTPPTYIFFLTAPYSPASAAT